MAREAKLWRLTFLDSPFGASFVDRFRDRFSDQRLDGLYPAFPEEELKRVFTFRSRQTLRFATVAALFLLIPAIVLTGVVLNRRQPSSLGTYRVLEGALEGEPGWELPAGEEGHLFPGTTFRIPRECSLLVTLTAEPEPGELEDSAERSVGATRIEVVGPAVFKTAREATAAAFAALLDSGKLEAEVSRRGPGESFNVRTPHAEASVVGTQFSLEVFDDHTDLTVAEGEVAFRPLSSGATGKVVGAGDPHRIRRDFRGPEPIASRVTAPVATTPPATSPTSPPAPTSPTAANPGAGQGPGSAGTVPGPGGALDQPRRSEEIKDLDQPVPQ
jgi:hypothetical protein